MINQNKKMNLREKDRRGKITIAILLLIAIIGVGYAALGANLKINGVANIPSASWDVHFKTGSVAVTSGSVTGTNVTTAATITNATQVDYAVKLALPGDFYEFTVTAENTGSIDAMIDSVVSKRGETVITTGTLPSYIDYSVTYSDGVTIAPHHLLAASSEETYKVRIAYKTDIEASELPQIAETLDLNFQINYVQADGTETEVAHATASSGSYVVTTTYMGIGETIPSTLEPEGVAVRNNAADAMADWQYITGTTGDTKPLYLKYVLNASNEIEEGYVEFVVTEEMAAANSGMTAGTYTLRGGVNESSLTDQPIFIQNARILYDALGSQCDSNPYETTPTDYFSCLGSVLSASIAVDGHVNVEDANDNSIGCAVTSPGYLICAN